jgi:integrase
MSEVISDKKLKSWAKKSPAAKGERYEAIDASHPGFGVRVNDRGGIRFFAIARLPSKADPSKFHPRRLSIGKYGQTTDLEARIFTLADARAEADQWHRQAKKKKDPREELDRAERKRQKQNASTFEKAAEEFFRVKLRDERKGDEVERDIRKEFVDRWGKRQVADIERADIIEAIEEVRDRDAPYQAYNLLGYARRLFDWAVIKYDLDKSPCDRLRPRDFGLKKKPRKRILDAQELAAFWRAAEAIGYPYGPLFQILVLSGQRKSDIAECRWSEIDLKEKLLIIPAERFKSDFDHVVPLSEPVLRIFKLLPTFKTGDYLFSTTFGEIPVNGFSKAKARLDELMLAELRKTDNAAKLKPFTIQDIRRTMRSGLSALPVEQHVRELVIGHAQQGLSKNYDQYAYLNEKRHALDLWVGRLMPMVTPPPDNSHSLVRA